MNFTWCGQSCGSTSRAFLHAAIHDNVVERVRERIKYYKPGIPTDPATTMGAIISKTQFDRVMGFVDAAKGEGARLVTGGARPADPALAKGFYIEPTVFADVTQAMRIAREEVFGPVLSVLKWSDESAMLADVNAVEYGLTASIWTNDLSTAYRSAMAVQGGLRVDQPGRQAFPRRAVRRLQAIRHRPRGMLRRNAELHPGEEHPRAAAAGEVMRRRQFLTLLSGAAASCPFAALAQQPGSMPVVGVLMGVAEGDPESQSRIVAFRQGLADLGWTDGKNVHIEYRWSAGKSERFGNMPKNWWRCRPP